jgi:hypothetical protein
MPNITKSHEIIIKDIKLLDFDKYDTAQLKLYMLDVVEGMKIDKSAKDKLCTNIKAAQDNVTGRPLEELKKAATVLDIIKNTGLDDSSEIMYGAHVIIKDKGRLYDRLKEKGIVTERYSSHHNKNKPEGVKDISIQGGEIFREFLVGKTKDGKTWFQVEAHSIGGLKNFIAHLIDYIQYKITGKNVGQYGFSKHVDSNPIDVNIKKPNLVKKLLTKVEHSFVKKVIKAREESAGLHIIKK